MGTVVTSPFAPMGGMGKDTANAAMWGLLSGNRQLGSSKASVMRDMLSSPNAIALFCGDDQHE